MEGVTISEVPREARKGLVPILEKSFEGWYLWHSRRTLYKVEVVRQAVLGGSTVGLILLKELGSGIGYVYYLAVLPDFRRRGIGGALLDDALAYFSSRMASCVYASVEVDNDPSLSLLRSRGFAAVGLEDMSKLHGKLKALGMMLRMQTVAGEVVLRKELLGSIR